MFIVMTDLKQKILAESLIAASYYFRDEWKNILLYLCILTLSPLFFVLWLPFSIIHSFTLRKKLTSFKGQKYVMKRWNKIRNGEHNL